MPDTLAAVLEKEHHEIDAGIEVFIEGLDSGEFLTDEVKRAADALRRHIYLEERFLFPPIRNAGMVPPVLVMLREHGVLWQILDTLEEEIEDAGPEGGDSTNRAALDIRCRQLLEELQKHNSKEEPVIYPQGDVALSDYEKERLQEFIERGSMPEGWVCEQG